MTTGDKIRSYLGRLSTSCATHRLARRLWELSKYRFEGNLIICSLWAAWVLYHPPSNFLAYPASFAVAESMQLSESTYAAIALSGALIKAAGLTLWAINRTPMITFTLRCLGLTISCWFWLVMGTSAVIGNTDSLMCILALVAGVNAFVNLLAMPATPPPSDTTAQ